MESRAGKTAQKAHGEKKGTRATEGFDSAYKTTFFNEFSDWGRAAKEMLVAWEAGDEAVVSLWKTMNQWVFDGFDATYKRLGVAFDKVYYESETYLLGKDLVETGQEKRNV